MQAHHRSFPHGQSCLGRKAAGLAAAAPRASGRTTQDSSLYARDGHRRHLSEDEPFQAAATSAGDALPAEACGCSAA